MNFRSTRLAVATLTLLVGVVAGSVSAQSGPPAGTAYRFESVEVTTGGTAAASTNFVGSVSVVDTGDKLSSASYMSDCGIGETAVMDAVAGHQVFGVSPALGPCAGGGLIRILGMGFTDGNPPSITVKIGQAPEFQVTTFTNTEITCPLPAGYPGPNDIVVTTPCGSKTLPGGFEYACANGPLALFGVTPASSDVDGGALITVSGLSLMPGTLITFGGTPAYDYTFVDLQTIRCRAPAHPTGTFDVTATNSLGSVTLSNAFTYTLLARVQVVSGGCSGNYGSVQNLVGGSLPLVDGSQFSFVAANARPNAVGFFVAGVEVAPYPVLGCVGLVEPLSAFIVPMQASPYGTALFPVALPANPALAGFTFMSQWAFSDATGPAGFVLSNGIRARFGF
jgi:IPT/TIG domain